MSPWSVERLLIGLYPDRLLWLRHDARLRVRAHERLSVGPAPVQPRWAGALALLRDALTGARAEASVVLSSHFVRYALVPWSVHASQPAQREEMARHAFAQVHGAAAEGWCVQVSDGALGAPLVAAAVDRALLDGIDEVCAAARVRLVSVQPHLMAAFNRFHAKLGRTPKWLAVVEPGALCLGLLARGRWQRLLCRRSGADWVGDLRTLLMQETCLGTGAASTRELRLYAPGLTPRRIGAPGEWRVQYLAARDEAARAGAATAATG